MRLTKWGALRRLGLKCYVDHLNGCTGGKSESGNYKQKSEGYNFGVNKTDFGVKNVGFG